MKYTKEDERYFYAGDTFNRDSTICAYNCTDSGTLTATATIDDAMLKSLSGNSGVFAIKADCGDWSPVKLSCVGECVTDTYATQDTVSTLSTSFKDMTLRLDSLEKSFTELAQAMRKSASSIDRAAFKTLSPKYEVL